MVGAGLFVAKSLSRLYFPAIRLRTLNCCTKMTAKITWAESKLLAAESRVFAWGKWYPSHLSELPFGGAVREFLRILLPPCGLPQFRQSPLPCPEEDWSAINPDCGDPQRYCLGDSPSKVRKEN